MSSLFLQNNCYNYSPYLCLTVKLFFVLTSSPIQAIFLLIENLRGNASDKHPAANNSDAQIRLPLYQLLINSWAPSNTVSGRRWKFFCYLSSIKQLVRGKEKRRQTLEYHSSMIHFVEDFLYRCRVVCDGGFWHSQPNLLRES